jgi:hypothetical protein
MCCDATTREIMKRSENDAGLYVNLFDAEHLFQPRTDLPITLICAYDAAILPAIKDLDITFFYKRINSEWKQFVDAYLRIQKQKLSVHNITVTGPISVLLALVEVFAFFALSHD